MLRRRAASALFDADPSQLAFLKSLAGDPDLKSTVEELAAKK